MRASTGVNDHRILGQAHAWPGHRKITVFAVVLGLLFPVADTSQNPLPSQSTHSFRHRSPSSEHRSPSSDPSGAASYYTLDKGAQVVGPVQGPSLSRKDYTSAVFQIILSSARLRATPYLKAGDSRAYWAFLAGALALPYHESGLRHFQRLGAQGSRCDPELNSGAPLKARADPDYYSIFMKTMRGGDAPLVPDCEKLDSSSQAVQLVTSPDGASVGIMRVNLRWHPDEYFLPQKFLSVQESVGYGLDVFFDGFQRTYLAAASGANSGASGGGKLSCLESTQSTPGDPVDYVSLVRSAWSIYDGGPGASCRWATSASGDSEGGTPGGDAAFYEDFKAVLSTSATENNPYARDLEGIDRAAYLEVIEGFTGHKHINPVLATTEAEGAASVPDPTGIEEKSLELPQKKASSKAATAAMAMKAVMAVEPDQVNARLGPSLESKACGVLPHGTQVTVLETQGGWSSIQSDPALARELGACAAKAYIYSDGLGPSEKISAVARVTGTRYLEIRSEPPRGRILELLKAGTEVEIVASRTLSARSQEPWYQVAPSHGWVSGAYLRILSGNPSPGETKEGAP